MSPAEVAEALPVIREPVRGDRPRSRDARDLGPHLDRDIRTAGRARVDLLAGYREQGVSRVMGLLRASARSDEALESLVEEARAAGLELA